MVNFYLWINPSDTVVGKGDFIQTIQLETDSLSVTNRGQLIKPAHQHSEMVQISSSDAVKMPMIIPLAVATAGTSIYFKAVKKSVNKSKER